MPKIDTLVDDIYGLFKQKDPFDTDLFKQFGTNLEEGMAQRFNVERDNTPRLRMSNIARPDRQLWMDINSDAPKEELLPHTLVKFSYGDMIEELMLLYARMAGHEVSDEQKEVEVNGIKGHIDAIIDGVVVDVKSASTFSFQKFESGALLEKGNDPFGYLGQLAGYVEALTPGKEGAFLAVDKTLGKITLLRVPPEVLQQFRVRDRIDHIKQVVENKDLIPEHCYAPVPDGKSGNMKLATGCSYCGHKFECWPGLKTYYYSTGPRYLTKVVREPKVKQHKDFPDA